MSQRYIDGPATQFENISFSVLTGVAGGGAFGDMIAGAPFIGMALGSIIGLAIGWLIRNVGTKQSVDAPNSPSTQQEE
jgi:NhaP-type Na+/H+ or K+/H+ antiporter